MGKCLFIAQKVVLVQNFHLILGPCDQTRAG